MLFVFHERKNATESNQIFSVYGIGVVSESACPKWVARFKNQDFD